MHSRVPTLFVLLLALAALSFRASAQDLHIEVQPSERAVYIGVPFNVVVKLERSDQEIADALVEFDATDDFEIAGPHVQRGAFSSSTLVNGVLKQQVKYQAAYQFSFTAIAEGELEIPSVTVTADGQQFRKNPLPIRASVAPPLDFATLTISPGRADVFVGQAVPIEVRFESSRAPSRVALTTDRLPSGVTATPGNRRPMPGEDAPPLRIFGAEGNAFKDAGHPGLAFTEPLILIPEAPGSYEIGPVAFVVDFGARSTERHIVQADPMNLSVRPLPLDGRPPAFNGIVGTCTVEAAISAASARVGDPLTLTIRLTADLPPDRVPAPRLDLQSDIAESFRLASEGWIDVGINGNSRIYSMTIRPQKAGVSELPPIQVHWFDPVSERYRVSSSRPLAMKVEASREVTAADAIGRGSAPITREALADSASRVRANRTDVDRLVNYAPDFATAWSSPWRSALLLGPPCVWMGIAGIGALLRRRDPIHARRDRLVRKAISHARRSRKDARRAGLAARDFVAAHGGMTPDAVTSADAENLHLSPSDPDATTLLEALRSAEASDYDDRAPTHPPTDLANSLRRLNRTLKARSGSTA